jgi:hypothetical protein
MAKFPPSGSTMNEQMAFTAVPFQLSYDDASGTYYVPVPAGTLVVDILTVVTQVCDGTPTLKIGDSADDDGYLTSANIAPGTALTTTTPAVHRSTGIANPYQFGKYYPTADNITFTWVAGTSPTTGQIKGFVVMGSVRSGGIAAALTS